MEHLLNKVQILFTLLQEIAISKKDNCDEQSEAIEPEETNQNLQMAIEEYDEINSESEDEDDCEENLPRDTDCMLIPGIYNFNSKYA